MAPDPHILNAVSQSDLATFLYNCTYIVHRLSVYYVQEINSQSMKVFLRYVNP